MGGGGARRTTAIHSIVHLTPLILKKHLIIKTMSDRRPCCNFMFRDLRAFLDHVPGVGHPLGYVVDISGYDSDDFHIMPSDEEVTCRWWQDLRFNRAIANLYAELDRRGVPVHPDDDFLGPDPPAAVPAVAPAAAPVAPPAAAPAEPAGPMVGSSSSGNVPAAAAAPAPATPPRDYRPAVCPGAPLRLRREPREPVLVDFVANPPAELVVFEPVVHIDPPRVRRIGNTRFTRRVRRRTAVYPGVLPNWGDHFDTTEE